MAAIDAFGCSILGITKDDIARPNHCVTGHSNNRSTAKYAEIDMSRIGPPDLRFV